TGAAARLGPLDLLRELEREQDVRGRLAVEVVRAEQLVDGALAVDRTRRRELGRLETEGAREVRTRVDARVHVAARREVRSNRGLVEAEADALQDQRFEVGGEARAALDHRLVGDETALEPIPRAGGDAVAPD